MSKFKNWLNQKLKRGTSRKNTLLDSLVNSYLNFLNNIRYLLHINPKKFKPHKKHTHYFFDNFSNLEHWNKNLWWGQYAYNEKVSWMNPDNIQLVEEGVKIIYKKEPRENIHTGDIMNWSTGTIESKEVYGKGSYEVVCKIHPGRGVWHAPFWGVTKGDGSKEEFKVLPEPDICEFYVDDDINKYRAQSNFHYGENYEEGHNMVGAITHKTRNIYDREISFGMIWEDNYIEFYYDGYLVRRITNPEIMNSMKEQLIIIGSGVMKGEREKYIEEGGYLIIKSFKYWKK